MGFAVARSNGSVEAPELEPGALIDMRYVLTRELARGTFSVVFEARHRHVGRAVVMKFPTRGAQRDAYAARLMREARALDTVRHPGVVDVIDAGICPTFGHYLAMERLEGRTLDGILAARQRLAPDVAVRIARELCASLEYVHARGVVHRDLKPSNMFVTWNTAGEECTRLLDFGVAHVGPEALPTGERKLTLAGQVLGTPEYMAPEQLMADHARIDLRTDVYGLGVTLWECLVGDIPVMGTYPEVLQFFTQNQRVPSIRTVLPGISPALASAIDRALERDPGERHPSMAAFARALDAAMPGLPPTRLLGAVPAIANALPSSPVAAVTDDPSQRRKFPRAPYLAPIRILRIGAECIDGRIDDVSEAGLLLILPLACRKDEIVQLRFALPGVGTVVTATATVRWVREGRGRVAAGLEFEAASPELRGAIARYIESMTAR